ncbi:MAG: CopD family protein [Bauldia sp.]|nr:CopD family protein [Bauldia sp.]
MLLRLLSTLFVLAGVAFATPAFSHATLISTEPATGAVLAEAPSVLTLTFNELVEPTAARLITADGETIQLPLPTAIGPDVTVLMPTDVGEGTHVLSWRVVSSDGHPIGGTVVLSVGTVTGTGEGVVTSDPAVRPAIWVARVLVYLGLFIGAGGTFFAAWISAPSPLPAQPKRIMRVLMVVGIVAIPVAFALQGVDLIGADLGDVFSGDALATAWSSTYTETLVVALIALVAGLVALARPAQGRLFSLVAILGIGLALSLSGHASRAPPEALSWLVVFIHATTVAFWAGALLPLRYHLGRNGKESAAVLGRFSAVIPHALLPLVVAGVLLILIQVDSPADIFATDYGRLLAIKLSLVTLLLALALVNRFRLTPLIRRQPAEAARLLRRTVGAELLLVVIVFGVVAGWRFTPPPRSLNAAGSVASSETPRVVPDAFALLRTGNFGASVTVSPGGTGAVAASAELLTADGAALEAREVRIALGYPAGGIEPVAVDAARQEDGTWRADGFYLPVAGDWTLTVIALISDFDRRTVTGPVTIADPASLAAIAAAGDGHDHVHTTGPGVDLTDPFQVIDLDPVTAPTMAMSVTEAAPGTFDLGFVFERFRFGTDADGYDHVPGIGHAHVYVNGIYETDLTANAHRLALDPDGHYEVYVGLNGLDHRAFVADGRLVEARVAFRASATAPLGNDTRVFDVPIATTGEPPTIRVRQGETIELRLTSLETQVVHLHGIDLEVAVAPQSPVTLLFNAEFPGRFVAEAHDAAESPVFFLEVLP